MPTNAAQPDPAPVCAAHLGAGRARFLARPMPALHDEEGDRIPDALPEVIDAHVHLFPDNLFEAIWRWFEQHGWPVRYRLRSPAVIEHLLARGVSHVVAMCYAHRAGMARALNAYMAEIASHNPRVTALATVMPGEEDARAILEEAFALGLRGVKLHCHVQCFAPDDERMSPIYEACAAADLPIVMHAGREPASPAYRCDPYALCAVERIEAVLRSYPRLRLCVPHLGADEFQGYMGLLERYDNLWLDTTMMMAEYFPLPDQGHFVSARPDRVMYGTDFPNIPYAWDRELRRLAASHGEEELAQVLGGTARRFFRIGGPPLSSG